MPKCKTCNAQIVFGILAAGEKIPLETTPETYFYSMMDEGATIAPVGTYVRHYCFLSDTK